MPFARELTVRFHEIDRAGIVYFARVYEYCHAQAHLRGPVGTYSHWLRIHHFHHHFGHPMSNHGVSVPWWDRVFGTLERPERVRVPRRLAMGWLLWAAQTAMIVALGGLSLLLTALQNPARK